MLTTTSPCVQTAAETRCSTERNHNTPTTCAALVIAMVFLFLILAVPAATSSRAKVSGFIRGALITRPPKKTGWNREVWDNDKFLRCFHVLCRRQLSRRLNNKEHHAWVYTGQRLRATPRWAETKLIESLYQLRAILGPSWTIDHIVPLNSREVCGLHCIDNLRIIPRTQNYRKSNHTWPDQPDSPQLELPI